MKLSEAIRLGAMMKPQAFGSPWTEGTSGACALEAARLATNCGFHWWTTMKMWPWLRIAAVCPVADCFGMGHASKDYIGVIYHLNDTHKWTRERIADWVETLESQVGRANQKDPEKVGVRG